MTFQNLSDRWLRADLARFVAWVVLAMVAGLLAALFATTRDGRTAFGSTLGADYGEFHAVGTLLNRGQVARLYDLDLQDEILHQTLPGMPSGEHLPFAYPPFLAPLFRPLARLPYAWSFATWLLIGLAAYLGAVGLMLRKGVGLARSERTTVWLLALSFEPFAMECWLGGQLSSLGCLAIASGLALRDGGRPFLSGLALSGLLYKPTLALLILPLMVVGRRWRQLGGFLVGALVLGLLSLGVAGWAGCREFLGLMAGYGRSGGSVGEGFRTMKYVDLRAFFRLLGVDGATASLLAVGLGLFALAGLLVAWREGDRGPRGDLAWSAALCWTPVLNLYGPIYDVSIVVPGLILAARTLRCRGDSTWPPAFRWLLAALYLSALFSPAMARGLGFQPLTLALAAMGVYLTRESLLGRSIAQERHREQEGVLLVEVPGPSP